MLTIASEAYGQSRGGTPPASPRAAIVHEAGDHVTTASIVIDAPIDQVYALVTDYAHWPTAFTDIESVRVKSGGRDNATVRFRSRAIGYSVAVQFENISPRLVRFRGVQGPPGSKARGEYVLTPIDNGRRTKVDAKLYIDISGPAGLIMRDRKVRAIRQAKLAADLNDAARWFARKRSSDVSHR